MRFAVVSRDSYAARLELGEQRFEFFIRDYFYLVHDRNQRLIAHPFLFKLQRGHHAIDQADCHAIG